MATNITNSFDTIYLTAHLPENVYIGTSASSIVVEISVDGDTVFSSTYYPYNQVVCVRDIRSIVEAAMFDQGLDMATLQIEAREPGGASSVVDDVKVICSDFKSALGSEAFLLQNFLTTRDCALVPRNGRVLLHNYAKAYAQGSNYAVIHYSVYHISGQTFQYNVSFSSMQSTTTKIVSANLTYAYFKGMVDNAYNTNCKVHGVEYHIGNRQFNIFFTDEEPTEQFEFLNAFNMQETVYLFGTTTTKTEVERSEALCGRKSKFYDETVKVKHEVETAPMPYKEAKWLSQMFTSRWVVRPVGDGMTAEVLISDITSEVTDSDKELIRLKFAWKYADGVEWL